MRKGSHHSEETKRKMQGPRPNMKGNQNAKGCRWRQKEGTKKLISEKLRGNQNGKGYKHTEEWKKQRSEEMSGENNPMFGRRGRRHPMFSKHHSEEAKQKMRKHLLELFHDPRNHPMYIDGSSFEPYSPGFNEALKRKIRERDNYTCQWCRISQSLMARRLDIHHIDFNKKNNDPSNLCALCRRCNVAVRRPMQNDSSSV